MSQLSENYRQEKYEINTETLFSLLRSTANILVNKNLLNGIGSENAMVYAEMLSKEDYFKERDMLTPDGFFYCISEEIEISTGFNAYKQKKIFDDLESKKLIETKLIGLPAKKYFKVCQNPSILISFLEQGNWNIAQKREVAQQKRIKSSFPKIKKLESEKLRINNNRVNNNKQYGVEQIPHKKEYGLFDKTKSSGKTIDDIKSSNCWINNIENPQYTDFLEFINNYVEKDFPRIFKNKHPYLSDESIDRILDVIHGFCSENLIDVDELDVMLNGYLNDRTLKGKTDFSIAHFATEGVLSCRMFNAKRKGLI